jgi:ribonuclease HI/uncharacterized phage-like protein YoqJ
MPTIVYTDGACIGNPGPGGWAWAVPGGAFASGAAADSTNQRMEVTAALEAVRALDGELTVVSDSQYVVNCHRDRWFDSWEAKGWKNSQGKPVANLDLWKPLVAAFRQRGEELTFTWVRGHSDDPMNDLVDRLAVEAAKTQTGRRGDEPPTDLGEADDVQGERAGAPGATAPSGHRVVVVGHRPPDLGGYGDNPVARDVRRRLTEILRGLHEVHADLVVLTGLGLGVEQLAAHAAADAGVPYVAVLPFPAPDAMWPAASRAEFAQLVKQANTTITLSRAKPKSKPAAGKAIGRRNDWLVRNASGALAVWDGANDPALGKTVRALEQRIPDDVWVVPPRP